MDSLLISIRIITPVIVLMGIGYVLKRSKALSDAAFAGINRLIYILLLPCTLFKSIVSGDLSGTLGSSVIWLSLVYLCVFAVVSFFTVKKVEKDPRKQGAICLALFMPNLMIIAMPIIQSIFPEGDLTIAMVLIALYVPIGTAASIVALQATSLGQYNIKRITAAILKNPLNITAIIGFVFALTHLPVPGFVNSAVNSVSAAAMPVSLIALGGSFSIPSIKNNKVQLTAIMFVKLFLMPAVPALAAFMSGLRGIELAAVLIIFASPTAVGSYPIAAEMNGDTELSSQSVILSNLLCVISYFIWISLFTSLNAF